MSKIEEALPITTVEEYEQVVYAACLQILLMVNRDAENDMLKGNPVSGAHSRAINRRLLELKQKLGWGEGDDTS